MVSFTQFEEQILIGLYQEHVLFGIDENVLFRTLIAKYGLESKPGWPCSAFKDLVDRGVVSGPKNASNDDMAFAKITGRGMRQIEEKYGAKDGVGLILEPVDTNKESSRADELIRQLVPASDRVVSIGHNAQSEAATVAVDGARRLISDSNSLAVDEKSDLLVHLDAGVSILRRAKSTVVGTFKYLIIDRLKAAFESSIEDAFKVAILAALFLMLTFIISLL